MSFSIGDLTLGNPGQLFLLAGPCVLQERDLALRIAEQVRDICARLEVPYVFKASFDKANRSSWSGHRGPGLEAGLELLGRTLGMGISCGVLAINIGHELGHRRARRDQAFAQLLLWSSAYAHFYVEHNRGHHARVGSHEDPATARKNEPLQLFVLRSIVMGVISAWRLEAQRLRRRGMGSWSWRNQALLHFALQLASWALLWGWLGTQVFLPILAAQLIGILLLESVDYIEHYGLVRRRRSDGRLEPFGRQHAWNANHPLGRSLLFDLTRHSDHHADATRPYQVLRHLEGAPALPFGYSAAVLVAWLPPLWFLLMNPRVDAVRKHFGMPGI